MGPNLLLPNLQHGKLSLLSVHYNIAHLKVPKINDICKALAKIAKSPPPTVALQTQNVVAAFHRTKAE